jgi:hypothetical protein
MANNNAKYYKRKVFSFRRFIKASSRWQQQQWHTAVLSLSEQGKLFDGP